ncbi:hypothetical protein MLAC_00070 [Mycobacterium lacus]|uniref:PPE domain-containing protein n=1 Tax=Mycobacterium lacus TaxID=169765 RepID=A0A7I7NEE3_9MYCO|nr:hypothetical protein MLAC_00070 [Mycobacterium lacus]
MASAFEAARAAMVHPLLVAANRNAFVHLVLSNLFGFNAPAIAAEGLYEEMWAADVAAMVGYHGGASSAAAALTPWGQVLQALPSLGIGNIGASNLGSGNKGDFNVGSGNIGNENLGGGNIGNGNLGSGNVGDSNWGAGNTGNANWGSGNGRIGVPSSGNFGDGNLGNNNVGSGNTGNSTPASAIPAAATSAPETAVMATRVSEIPAT